MRNIREANYPGYGCQRRDIFSMIEDLYLRLRRSWDIDTAHKSCYGSARRESSKGQCYVSAMVVAHVLDSVGINATITRGTVYSQDKLLIADHGWVEFIFDREQWVCDLTLDQAKGMSPILMMPMNSVEIDYRAIDYRSIAAVTNIDVLSRFWILSSRVFAYEVVSNA